MVFACDPGLLSEVVLGGARGHFYSGQAAPSAREIVPQRHANSRRRQKPPREAGADALSLVNTFVALAIDARTRTPRLGNGFGGTVGTSHQTHRLAHGLRKPRKP